MTVVLICMALGLVTVLLHQSGLLGIAQAAARIPERRVGIVVPAILMGIFGLHLCEIGLYAIAMWLATDVLHLGQIVGDVAGTSLDLVYFSAETYTSLGFGDLLPVGPVRLLAGTETLNGLLLIGWTASYAYLAMERFWREEA